MDGIKYRPSYPMQEHIDIDVECEVLKFPQKSMSQCQHAAVLVDTKAMDLICKDCDMRVNPVMWIKDHMHYFASVRERSLVQSQKAKADYEELQTRAKTKCDNCGKMTGIKLKNFKFRLVE